MPDDLMQQAWNLCSCMLLIPVAAWLCPNTTAGARIAAGAMSFSRLQQLLAARKDTNAGDAERSMRRAGRKVDGNG